ncbi:hypothetical protein D0T50_03390 [Bacteroides sp. 214]|uniref:hypothetical protein n=1 Tax=Bacteroides sp. 214 TaxID=2302935 RepID=UPI0013D198B8|nr:hypothetical protein [Bacteroides sp. 214]NDW11933.1 hypothetical protein [Bacteroides sp. 214]
MSPIKEELKKFPKTTLAKIKSIYGSIDKFYATVYLIARNEHQCQTMPVAAAEQRLRTIHAYQGMIRFMLDEEGLEGKRIMDDIASDYLEDFVQYKEQDFGMTDEEFLTIIKRIG